MYLNLDRGKKRKEDGNEEEEDRKWEEPRKEMRKILHLNVT